FHINPSPVFLPIEFNSLCQLFWSMELFHKILKAAVDGGASDIHIKVGTPVIFRISRSLIAIEAPIPTEEWMQNVAEHIVPKHVKTKFDADREIDFSYYAEGIGRFRTNIFQQRGSLCLAMRHVKTQVPEFDKLGLPEVLKQIAESPRGIILVAGSTGSGKSTTLAAMIEHVNATSRKHIVTMEDPIEFVFEDNQSIIEQREVGLDTQSFQTGLKHVLRQDPDLIMVGEMRDSVSFAAAMSAADTGHLVLSTLHTTTAALSVTRILDFFKADEREQIRRQLAGTLRAVICQRMVPTIGGGMTPAIEIMINTPTVRKLIEENRLDKLPAAIETGQDDGMQNFNQALFKLVQEGRVSREEALLKATNAQALEMNFQGIFLTEGKRILG
ncbi:MAG: type IV pilus twitching motility protein PilT, partial [Limisphaerales bacterium]